MKTKRDTVFKADLEVLLLHAWDLKVNVELVISLIDVGPGRQAGEELLIGEEREFGRIEHVENVRDAEKRGEPAGGFKGAETLAAALP